MISPAMWAKVHRTPGCWLWTGSINRYGYGRYGKRGREVHRQFYEAIIGSIPEGLTIDHLCRVRHCVNPAHMEPVTRAENILRGVSVPAVNARKTHCSRGHELTDSNIYRSDEGRRRCRKCRLIRYREAAA